MSDDEIEQQKIVLLDVRARHQEVEDLLMEHGWEGIAVRTNHCAFEWRRGAIEEPPERHKRASTRRKVRGLRRLR
jgi:hypothetical protein